MNHEWLPGIMNDAPGSWMTHRGHEWLSGGMSNSPGSWVTERGLEWLSGVLCNSLGHEWLPEVSKRRDWPPPPPPGCILSHGDGLGLRWVRLMKKRRPNCRGECFFQGTMSRDFQAYSNWKSHMSWGRRRWPTDFNKDICIFRWPNAISDNA